MKPPIAAILAGGQSQRMGRDKAGIMRQGETLLARAARIAQEAGLTVLVVGRGRPDDWLLPDTQFVPDAYPGQGPLGGLATALEDASQDVLLLACDMPLLSAEALIWLDGQALGRHGLAVRSEEQWEPLFSVYTTEVLPLVQQRLETGKRSMHSLIEAGEFRSVAAPPEVAAALVNVNTPEEWAKWDAPERIRTADT
jgi:molybdopterin-guanine dinucleotide biosynthesis protein A